MTWKDRTLQDVVEPLVELDLRSNSNMVHDVELVADADMEETGTGRWTGYNATLSKQTTNPLTGGQVLRITASGVGLFGAIQSSALVTGRTYNVTAWGRGDWNVPPCVGDNAVGYKVGTTSSAWQDLSVCATAGGTTFWLYSYAIQAGDYIEFDMSRVRLYSLLADADMEAAATTAWSAGNNATLSKQADPYEGTRCLRAAYNGTSYPYAYQTVLTVGNTYRVRGWARGDGSVYPDIWTGSTQVWQGTSSSTWQYFDATFIAAATTLLFYAETTSAGYAEFDAVRLEDCPRAVKNVGTLGGVFFCGDGNTPSAIPTQLHPRGLRFDGASDYLMFPANPNMTFASGGSDLPFSVEVMTGGNNAFAVFKGAWGSTEEWGFYVSAHACLICFQSASVYIGRYAGACPLVAGRDYHLIATYDGSGAASGINIYVNGRAETLTGASNGSYTSMSNKGVYLGVGIIPALQYYAHDLKHLAIYPSALTPTQVAYLYRRSRRLLNTGV